MTQPLYEAVKMHVLDHIRDGRWVPGDRIPSENELVKHLNVSRMTANRALKELTQEGLLVREHGRGTFVAERRMRSHPLEIRSIREDIIARGEAYSVETLKAAMEKARSDIAQSMRIKTGDPVLHLKLVHFANGVAQQMEDRFVRATLAPELLTMDFQTTSPSQYLLDKVPLHHAEHTVRAALPSTSDANALKIKPTDPVLIIYRHTVSDGQVASIATFTHPADQFELSGTFSK